MMLLSVATMPASQKSINGVSDTVRIVVVLVYVLRKSDKEITDINVPIAKVSQTLSLSNCQCECADP